MGLEWVLVLIAALPFGAAFSSGGNDGEDEDIENSDTLTDEELVELGVVVPGGGGTVVDVVDESSDSSDDDDTADDDTADEAGADETQSDTDDGEVTESEDPEPEAESEAETDPETEQTTEDPEDGAEDDSDDTEEEDTASETGDRGTAEQEPVVLSFATLQSEVSDEDESDPVVVDGFDSATDQLVVAVQDDTVDLVEQRIVDGGLEVEFSDGTVVFLPEVDDTLDAENLSILGM